MNNNQFRKLVLDQTSSPNPNASPTQPSSSTLPSKRSGLMPMTPRIVSGNKSSSGVDFARQVRERNAALQPPTKKFRSSAPKGSRFAAGYTDRAKARAEAEEEEEDDRAERIKALEEQMRLGEISTELFEALRDKIVGGDVGSTHLVKGLDRRLLERVRRGENVFEEKATGAEGEGEEADVDDELDKLGEKDVEAVRREKADKKGSLAGRKRTRDEIMAELKAQRAAAKEAAKVVLDESKWKKVGETQDRKIEIDHKGREVLITVDEDGNVKKKVRKAKTVAPEAGTDEAPRAVLGEDAVVPNIVESEPAPADDSDDDIFENVGAEYNPLGEDSSDDEASKEPSTARNTSQAEDGDDLGAKQPRNYFGNKPSETEETEADRRIGIENIIKKAAKMDPSERNGEIGEDESDEEKRARLKKRAQMLAQEDRDMEDMDMGFGSSRFEDEEEGGEGSKIRLSQWKGNAGKDDEGWEEGEKGVGKKKRKPKKRKGDVNNAADIMRVIEGRKAAGK